MVTFKKLSTAIATGAVLLQAVAGPALATGEISGNGTFSQNAVSLNNTTTTSVTQNNTANVSNNIDSNASTGGNSASFNTGGETTVSTGDATNVVDVSTSVNTNHASIDSCACLPSDTDVTISGNGAFSTNGAGVNNTSTTALTQNNVANITNNISADAKTGNNDAGFNTGGDTTIVTGKAGVGITVDNKANSNLASIGGGAGAGAGDSSIIINDNGAFSENAVELNNNSIVVLTQLNDADVANNIDADARTGGNSTDFNTGGDTTIWTGNATTLVEVDNMVNFNAASVGCECVLGGGVDLKIAGNGAYSFSGVESNDNSVLAVTALNDANLLNDIEDDAKTGHNDAGFNTSDVNGDPIVKTGNAVSSTEVSNSGNVNVFSQGASLDLPGDWGLNLNFDLLGLWGLLHWTV